MYNEFRLYSFKEALMSHLKYSTYYQDAIFLYRLYITSNVMYVATGGF